MTNSEFRSLQIGDQVQLLSGVINRVTNQYIRVLGSTPVSFIVLDGDNRTPIMETAAPIITRVAQSHPVVINTDGFESRPFAYVEPTCYGDDAGL